MLYTESKTLDYFVNESARLSLLDRLRVEGYTALIRSTRRRCFELALTAGESAGQQQVDELERMVAARCEAEAGGTYTPGELFCLEDCVLFLVFGGADEDGMRAGIVYGLETANPLHRLNQFCERLSELVGTLRSARHPTSGPQPLLQWRAQGEGYPEGLVRFIARQDSDFVRVAKCLDASGERLRAAELLEDRSVRTFLRRTEEVRVEGYSPRLLVGEGSLLRTASVESLIEAGLLRREVRVRCRKTGHPLFDLPSADSLALITVSRARCSLCGATAADEIVEEVYNLSTLAASLLEGGAWLGKRLYQIICGLGVPESEIAVGPTSAYGESHLIANVCGDSFLFTVRDGDLSPSLSRRVAEVAGETEASHIVVVVTGTVYDEGRMRLYEYAWRRARDGRNLSVLILEGLDGADTEIADAFAHAVRCRLTATLFSLDAALGASAGQLVINRFRLMRESGRGAFSPPRSRRQPAVLLAPLNAHSASASGERKDVSQPTLTPAHLRLNP